MYCTSIASRGKILTRSKFIFCAETNIDEEDDNTKEKQYEKTCDAGGIPAMTTYVPPKGKALCMPPPIRQGALHNAAICLSICPSVYLSCAAYLIAPL